MKKGLYNFRNEICLIQEQIKQLEIKQKKLEKEKEKEIRKIDEVFECRIIDEKNKVQTEFTKFLEISNIIYKYSLFDINILGPILADLMTVFEEEKYNYYTVEYSYKEDIDIWDHNIIDCEGKAAFIVKESESSDLVSACAFSTDGIPDKYYHCCILDSISENGENYVHIYKGHNERKLNDEICLELKLALPYLKYQKPYVKDFIDYIINIRIKNGCELGPLGHLYLKLCLSKFIRNYDYKKQNDYEIQKNSPQKSKKKLMLKKLRKNKK